MEENFCVSVVFERGKYSARGCESPIRIWGVKMHSLDWSRKARLPGETQRPGAERGGGGCDGEGQRVLGDSSLKRDSVGWLNFKGSVV